MQGYRNLNRLVTLAWKQSKYVPRLYTPQLLDPDLTAGLIVLSGCADSWLSCTLLGGKSLGAKHEDWEREEFEAARQLAERYQDVYGDRYYLELQQFPELTRSTTLNQAWTDLAVITGINTVVTADVHYPFPDDNAVQRMLHAARRGGKSVAEIDAEWEYGIRMSYPTSDEAIEDRLVHQGLTPEQAHTAVTNTAVVAARCDVELPRSAPIKYLPATRTNGTTERKRAADVRLQNWIEGGIDYRMRHDLRFADRWFEREGEYLERIHYEFGLIESKGFCDYFLVTADIVRWAKDTAKMGVGPGRGSAAASLICYLLRITEIDPMAFPSMLFERFIDPTRPDQPDIDIDFSRPGDVYAYAERRYGSENVSHIGNFVRYRGKSAIKDVGKSYRIPSDVLDRFGKFVIDKPDNDPRENYSIVDAIDAFDEAKQIVDEHPDLLMAARIEGDYRHLNVHACGVVISRQPIEETCAVYTKVNGKGENVTVIAYDKRDAEEIGMLKLDFLGLSTMAALESIVEMVPELTWEQIYALDFQDPKVLQAFSNRDLTGIFQFEGRTTRSIVRKVFGDDDPSPADFMRLADINALSRPGALMSKMTARYTDVERGRELPRTYHPVVDAILAPTNGCLVYQEQVMAIGRQFGGFPGEQVGALRRIIGKKKQGGAFDAFFAEFADGAKRLHGVDEEEAQKIWDFMATSSSYLFNVPHAVCYAAIAYWLMYAKVYHPLEFYVGMLRVAEGDKRLELMQDAVRHGIEIRPPSLYFSEVTWSKRNAAILAGFAQIDGVGDKIAPACVAWRNARFPDRSDELQPRSLGLWSDMRYRPGKTGRKTLPDSLASGVKGIGPKMVAKIQNFCASDDPFRIHYAGDAVAAVVDAIHYEGIPIPAPTADAEKLNTMVDEDVIIIALVKEVVIIDVLENERRRTNRTIEEIRAELDYPELTTRAKLICVDAIGVDIHVNIHRHLYPELAQDISSITEDVDLVHVIGVARDGYGPTVQARNVTIIAPLGEAEHKERA